MGIDIKTNEKEGYEIYDLMIALKEDKSMEELMREIKNYINLINK